MTYQMNDYIHRAEMDSQNGEWQSAIQNLHRALQDEPNDIGIMTGIGKCYLQLGDISSAKDWFQKVLSLAPEDTDALNNLGVLEMIGGDFQQSEKFFKKATEIQQDNYQAWKNLAVLFLKQEDRLVEGAEILISVLQVQPDDIEALLLMARVYEEGEDYQSAKVFYQKALALTPGHSQITEALKRVTQLSAPTDSSRIARPEHAKKLAALKGLSPKITTTDKPVAPPRSKELLAEKSCLFMGPPLPSSDLRLVIPAQALMNAGWEIHASSKLPDSGLNKVRSVVIGNPHMTLDLIRATEESIKAQKHLIIDLDRDFFNLPDDHPLYSICGPGSPETLKKLELFLRAADWVTVPNSFLADKLASFSSNIKIIPYTWGKWNAFWSKPAQPRSTINIGVLDRYTTPKEAALMVNAVKKILDEFPQTLLAIGSGLELIDVFSRIPDERKFFVPPSSSEDFPFTLSNIDILLLPSLMREYDMTASDYPLMEAGVRGIPWIASPLPSFNQWGEGGVFAETKEDWYKELKVLLMNINLNNNIRKGSIKTSQIREASNWLQIWDEIL